MSIIAWIVLGAIAGYLAGFIVKGDEGLGVIGHIVLGIVERIFDDLVAAHPRPDVWGVGIGLPGPVEFSNGSPTSPPIMPG